MAVIPSFSSYAPAPDLAGAYLGAQRIRQQAASDAARIQLGREQLAQEAVQAQMELAAKKEVLANEALRRAQEQEIEKAYRQTQIGLRERELANDEAISAMRVQEAAQGFQARADYTRAVEGGMPPDAAARRFLVGQPGFSTALTPKGAPVRETAGDRSLKYRMLQKKRDELAIQFLPGSPEYIKAVGEIDKQIEGLFPSNANAPEVSSGGLQAPVGAQQWLVNPETIPIGNPGNPQMFIGNPGGPIADPPMAPLALPSNQSTNTVRVLNVRRK